MPFTYQDAIHVLGGREDGRARERFVSEVANATAMTAAQAMKMFPGVSLSASESVMYFPMRMCHSLPSRNKRGRCFTAKTLANSYATAKDALVNIDHELVDNGTSNRDNICGHIVATAFDSSFQWKEAADIPAIPSSPIPMYALGALYTRHSKVPGIIKDHLSGRSKWDVSMECGHSWKDAHILFGDEFVPFIEAPGRMLECITRNGTGKYKEKEIAVALGGVNGKVDFWGLGMTECPADENAEILSFFAGTNPETANMGSTSVFLPLKSNIFRSAANTKLADQLTDTFLNELASIEVIGKTEGAEDGHTHEVLSNGTILPFNGHTHHLDTFSIKKGTTPRFTGQTNVHYLYLPSGSGVYPGLQANSGEIVHIHLIDIALRGKTPKDTPESASVGGSVILGDSVDELSFTGETSVKLAELLTKLDAISGRLSSGNQTDAAGIQAELAGLRAEVKSKLGEDEFASAVAEAVDAKVAAGELVKKEEHEAKVAAELKKVKDEQEAAQKEAEKKSSVIKARLEEVTGLGISIDHDLSEDEKSPMTIKSIVESIGVDDNEGFKRQVAVFKKLAASAVEGQKVEDLERVAANTGTPATKKKVPLLVGSPAGGKKTGESASASGSTPKFGKNAVTVV